MIYSIFNEVSDTWMGTALLLKGLNALKESTPCCAIIPEIAQSSLSRHCSILSLSYIKLCGMHSGFHHSLD